jgi:hypothetical protein
MVLHSFMWKCHAHGCGASCRIDTRKRFLQKYLSLPYTLTGERKRMDCVHSLHSVKALSPHISCLKVIKFGCNLFGVGVL